MTPSQLVERFYEDVWNQRDFDVAQDIIAEDFRFRGSLGPENAGLAGFWTMSNPFTRRWRITRAQFKTLL